MKNLLRVMVVGVLVGMGASAVKATDASAAYIVYGYNVELSGYGCLPPTCYEGWCCLV